MPKYLYFEAPYAGVVESELSGFTDRHKIRLSIPPLQAGAKAVRRLRADRELRGLVIGLRRGWVRWAELRLAKRAMRTGKQVWLYWPREEAIEGLDDERLRSYRRHWALVHIWQLLLRTRLKPSPPRADLERLRERTKPVALTIPHVPSRAHPLPACGAYLRTDFWVKIESGGSYGHTCYVAKALAAVTQKLLCFLPHRYTLLDQLGIAQVVMDAPAAGSEKHLVEATSHYYGILRQQFASLRPSYIYERLCLGNYVGARLSQELGIPYIAEYNGSEISMARSFGGNAYAYEDFYLEAEAVAFRQATLISVVSDAIKADLVARDIDPDKILVNPNGADLDSYAPPPVEEKRRLRRDLGWDDSHQVIGFTGTFGGWHGVDVLADAIPRIAQELPEARFLLIGDGNYKYLVDEQIERHRLQARVRAVGRVTQAQGARLLGACDVYVSPHHRHMINSRFFGSPTKIFEYMAMGGGIVASDLEQIGQVLAPALRPSDLADPTVVVTDQRAVLCRPGDVGELVSAVIGIAQRPDLRAALGRNARQAVADHYSWDRHVERLWGAVRGDRVEPPLAAKETTAKRLETGDPYKDQAQYQWDYNPVGSHYVKRAKAHTLEWFQEVEAHRYGEYAPWIPETLEFDRHAGHQVLEIGGGIGTDLAQFAKHCAQVWDVDLSAGHLQLAEENLRLRGLEGRFLHHDAESLPFEDGRFDLVYGVGVLHHTPNTRQVMREMRRVLKPGGRVIIIVYAENSLHYWYRLVGGIGVYEGLLADYSMGEIMSRSVEITTNGARPLVKVYTRERIRRLLADFTAVSIAQRHLTAPELPRQLRWMPVRLTGRLVGRYLVGKGTKPGRG